MKDKAEKELLLIFNRLDGKSKDQLIDFAKYLAKKSQETMPPGEINRIPRPIKETPIEAIKRLSNTYPMISKKKIMVPASDLLSEFMLKGKDAKSTIDDLETLFKQYYDEFNQ